MRQVQPALRPIGVRINLFACFQPTLPTYSVCETGASHCVDEMGFLLHRAAFGFREQFVWRRAGWQLAVDVPKLDVFYRQADLGDTQWSFLLG